jgi:hypothetical protein
MRKKWGKMRKRKKRIMKEKRMRKKGKMVMKKKIR